MIAQSLIEYSMVDALSSGLREFQIWLLDVRYTTWLIMGGLVLFVAFLWRFRPQR
jgi:hypothetical protein